MVPPGEEAGWSHAPFSGDIADGFIWGRGALDDKNALLGSLEAVEGLLAAGFSPGRTVYLGLGADEETSGERGAAAIVAALSARGVRLACVFDESSIMSLGSVPFVTRPIAMIGIAEKGFANVEAVVQGRAGHAAMPGTHTAAGALCAAVAALERRPFPLRLTPTIERFFHCIAPHARGPIGLALRLLRPLWPLLRGALAANPSVATLLRTTQAVTILDAGEKANVIPEQARAVINIRPLPGDTAESARGRIERILRRHLPKGFSLRVGFLAGTEASDPVPEKPLSPAAVARGDGERRRDRTRRDCGAVSCHHAQRLPEVRFPHRCHRAPAARRARSRERSRASTAPTRGSPSRTTAG